MLGLALLMGACGGGAVDQPPPPTVTGEHDSAATLQVRAANDLDCPIGETRIFGTTKGGPGARVFAKGCSREALYIWTNTGFELAGPGATAGLRE